MLKDFYCPNCHSIFTKINTDRNKNVSTDGELFIFHCNCDHYAVDIDHHLIHIIQRLNLAGLTTMFCCEGHLELNGDYTPAYITFDKKVSIQIITLIVDEFPLPDGWDIELFRNELGIENVIIRFNKFNDIIDNYSIRKFNIEREKYIKELYQWVIYIT